ncbi:MULTISPECIES: hypothetical protein [Streptomyces]|uniref:hypothetical protein n=1 Tax=Streptomyces TaxID=1883 RepID=UPI00034EC16C|nr:MULTISPECIES: hypothetical protein [Streptomyces]EPD93331.1 hypothetical protein HMPREF1486_03847 [Streptomyces sp. HPH0547]UVN54062.1 hypothetical protein NR995_05580 [Streptomyces albus]GHJ25376.1 hypothetical protein TPA0909_69900 [Streptomyces albus]
MTSSSGGRFTIRIGGDASGPVVAGHDNHVEVHGDGGEGREGGGPTQSNAAHDHGTVYTVMNGELHVHPYTAPQNPAPDGTAQGGTSPDDDPDDAPPSAGPETAGADPSGSGGR